MLQYLIIILVSFGASVIGAICGIGGGVIIKPVLDATGIMHVDTISFLSGCTVLSMSVVSVFKGLKRTKEVLQAAQGRGFDKKIATLLALGGVIGGLAGKTLYQRVLQQMSDANTIGAIQAIVLLIVTVGTLLYTIWKNRIHTMVIRNSVVCVIIGFFLGMMSAFLGIGGGPINLVVMFFFFSMSTKQAAIYSLYIIMFSQLSGLISSLVNHNVPDFTLLTLVLMVCCGIAGGLAGTKINKKIKERTVEKLFIGLMVVIILINIYNIFKYI